MEYLELALKLLVIAVDSSVRLAVAWLVYREFTRPGEFVDYAMWNKIWQEVDTLRRKVYTDDVIRPDPKARRPNETEADYWRRLYNDLNKEKK